MAIQTAPTGFEGLNAFRKPAACECNVSVKLERGDRTGTMGWRPGDNRIYYEDTAIAGHYPLPKPLNEMSRAELERSYPASRKYPVPYSGFLQLWSKATGTPVE